MASNAREMLQAAFASEGINEEGLQGALISAIVEEMGDPDVVAAKWLRERAVPLGIECEIEPGNIFPSATAAQAEEATDYWAPPNNYASFQEHKEQADKLLEKKGTKTAWTGDQQNQRLKLTTVK